MTFTVDGALGVKRLTTVHQGESSDLQRNELTMSVIPSGTQTSQDLKTDRTVDKYQLEFFVFSS